MSAAGRTAPAIAVAVLLGCAAPALGQPRDVWWGAGRIDPGSAAGRGFLLAATAITRDALPGEVETRFLLAREAGLGARVEWSTIAGAPGPATLDARAVVRGARHRLTAGVRRTRWNRRVLHAGAATAEIQPAEGVLAGGEVEAFAGEPASSVRHSLLLLAGREAWFGAVRLGPDAVWSWMGMVEARPGLVFTIRVGDAAPGFGVAYRIGSLELRAESQSHELLGSIHTVTLLLGGGA